MNSEQEYFLKKLSHCRFACHTVSDFMLQCIVITEIPRQGQKMKFFAAIVLLSSVMLSLTGCDKLKAMAGEKASELIAEYKRSHYERNSRTGKYTLSDEPFIFGEYQDAVVKALDDGDADALRNLFSKNILDEKRAEIDRGIADVLALYKAKSKDVYNDGLFAGRYSIDYGIRTSFCEKEVLVFTESGIYFLYIELCYRDDTDGGNVGIILLTLQTERGKANKSLLKSGIVSAIDDPGTEKTCCMAYGRPYYYTPHKRTLHKEQFAELAKKTQSLDAFKKEFGEPDAEDDGDTLYELPEMDEYGRHEFISIFSVNGTIKSISRVSSVKWLESIYKEN